MDDIWILACNIFIIILISWNNTKSNVILVIYIFSASGVLAVFTTQSPPLYCPVEYVPHL